MSRPAIHRRILRPLRTFLDTEIAGGVLLAGAAVVALLWANSPWWHGYESLWHTDLTLRLGNRSLTLDLRDWVNDGLMTIFFFVVGLEIKRELVQGELRDPRRALLPAFAAVGGMVVPALIFLAVNTGGTGHPHGWGVPIATDIAMALGALSLVGSARVPLSLSLFLLAVAIVDDIGAILVIAFVYSGGIELSWVVACVGVVVAVVALRRMGVAWTPGYVVVGAVLWFCMHEAGLHATLAGVVLGLLAPTTPVLRRGEIDEAEIEAELVDVSTPAAAERTIVLARHSVSVVERLEHQLHPWSSYLIVPIFALANAGIHLDSKVLDGFFTAPVAVGTILGLVIGKPVGIALASWLAVRTGVARLPEGVRWAHVMGIGILGGIGFTVSLLVSGLAFKGGAQLDQAKLAVLVASVVAGVIGVTWLRRVSSRSPR